MLGEHAGVLLGVEWVALGALEDRLLRVGVEDGAVEEVLEEARSVLVGERADRKRERIELAAAPTRPPVEQLRAGRSDDEEWNGRRPVCEVVDEVEQAVVGPVQVFEDEHEGPLLGRCLE